MNYKEKYNIALERAKYVLKTDIDNSGHWAINYIFPELKERNKIMVDSKSEELSKGTGELSGKNVRPLSSMTNIERQEWGLILVDELDEDPYSWLVRHNFIEDIEIDIGLFKTLKGPNPPVYL